MERVFALSMDLPNIPKFFKKKTSETIKNLIIAHLIAAFIICLIPDFWLQRILLYAVTIICSTSIIFKFVTCWREKGKIDLDRKAVVITGCDSGFGHLLAMRLDDLGFQVFAGCLFPEGDGANILGKSASSNLHVLKMDVTKDEDVHAAATYVKEKLENNQLWAIVCNAGMNDGGDIMWTNMEAIKRITNVNAFGVVRVTKAFLPQICKTKGRVVAVASVLGKYPIEGAVPYSMSKSAVICFCEGLRLEMYRWGVQVITVEPFTYRTNITNRDNVFSYADKAWDNAPSNIKEMYPINYIDAYKKSIIERINLTSSNNPREVVDCLEEAITAKNPKDIYNPGILFIRFSFWLSSQVPKPLAEMLSFVFFNVKYYRLNK